MSSADQRLAALLREDAPPPRDPAFRLAVMERMAQRQLRSRMAMVIGTGLATTLLVGAAAPSLSAAAGALSDVLPILGVGLAVLTAAWGLMQIRRPI